MLKDKANAKINLGLNIVGILPNGYHQLEMLELPLELADEISIFPSEEYNFICNVSLPENNTVYKAFEVCKNKLGDGSKWKQIAELNNISNPNNLDVGQVLKFVK